MENDLQPEDSISASPPLQQYKNTIDRNFDLYPALNSNWKLDDPFQQPSQNILSLVADKKGRQPYLISTSEYLPDTDIDIKKETVLDNLFFTTN